MRLPAAESAEADEDARCRRGARWAGLALLAGIVIPRVSAGPSSSGGTRLEAAGIWDFWSFLTTGTQISVGVLAALALLLMVLSVEGHSRVRSWLLLLAPLGVLVLHALSAQGAGFGAAFVGLGMPGMPILHLLTGLAAATLAAANRLRKVRQGAGLLRIAAVAAGGVGLGLCFIPPGSGELSIGAAVLGSDGFPLPWPLRVALGLLLAYFASAALHLVPLATRPVSRLLSLLGRSAAIALPVSIAVLPLLGDGKDTALASVAAGATAIKSPVLLIYPALIAFGLALVPLGAAWAAGRSATAESTAPRGTPAPGGPPPRAAHSATDLPPRRPPPEARPVPQSVGIPDAPVVRPPTGPPKPDPELDELRRRMARLDAAYSEGLLSDEEYRAKRKDVLEGFKF